jgi:hypothetical protein
MYARLSNTKNFNFDFDSERESRYTKLKNSPSSGFFLDDKKFILQQSNTKAESVRQTDIQLESQFFDTIRVPEQAHVVQSAISKTGR